MATPSRSFRIPRPGPRRVGSAGSAWRDELQAVLASLGMDESLLIRLEVATQATQMEQARTLARRLRGSFRLPDITFIPDEARGGAWAYRLPSVGAAGRSIGPGKEAEILARTV